MSSSRSRLSTCHDCREQIIQKKYIKFDFMNVQTIVQVFLEWIWKNEKYSENVVSDRKKQFVVYFWQRFCERINIKFKLSIAWHLEINNQTKNVNFNFKIYFRDFINYKQNDWLNWFSILEFENNSSKNVFIKINFFFHDKRIFISFKHWII